MLVPVHADDTPLAEEMDFLSGSLKKLRKAETAAEKVDLVHAAQKSTIKSLQYSPMVFKDIKDEKEKAKATADYKRLIGLTYAKLCELEMAYLAGDEEKADEIKGELKDLKKDGHEKYTD
jgi:bacterioferritin (cytochrome b1)